MGLLFFIAVVLIVAWLSGFALHVTAEALQLALNLGLVLGVLLLAYAGYVAIRDRRQARL